MTTKYDYDAVLAGPSTEDLLPTLIKVAISHLCYENVAKAAKSVGATAQSQRFCEVSWEAGDAPIRCAATIDGKTVGEPWELSKDAVIEWVNHAVTEATEGGMAEDRR